MFTEEDYDLQIMKMNAGMSNTLVRLYLTNAPKEQIRSMSGQKLLLYSNICIHTDLGLLSKNFVITTVDWEKIGSPPFLEMNYFFKIIKCIHSKIFIYDSSSINPEDLVFMRLTGQIYTKNDFYVRPTLPVSNYQPLDI